MERATSIHDVWRTLSPEPLRTPEELDSLYRPDVNVVRGQDLVARLKLELGRAHGGPEYKGLLVGHSGVGKSTELSRLERDVKDRFLVLRFSAVRELDVSSFQPFDIVLLMLIEALSRIQAEIGPLVLDAALGGPASALAEVRQWLAASTTTRTRASSVEGSGEGGAGLAREGLLSQLLGLSASIRGEIKYGSSRETVEVEYRLRRLSDLIEAVNRTLGTCNRVLRENTGKECLFIWEDFDKPGISRPQVEQFFIVYANVIRELKAHLILTIPIDLAYSDRAAALPFPSHRVLLVPDTPVYDAEHRPHLGGRAAVRGVLEARVDPAIFAAGQLDRLVVASGGNLRDLFSMVSSAADTAILRGTASGKVEAAHVDFVIYQMRSECLRRLGQSPYDPKALTYDQKVPKLLAIYEQKPAADVLDAVLNSLLRARAIQEFNGKRRLGLHPLVVETLREQGKLTVDENGKVAGGLE